jgi:hypothetical protein
LSDFHLIQTFNEIIAPIIDQLIDLIAALLISLPEGLNMISKYLKLSALDLPVFLNAGFRMISMLWKHQACR